jgi:hypothetical protein
VRERTNYEDHQISMDAEAHRAWVADGCRPSPEEERRYEDRLDAQDCFGDPFDEGGQENE